LPISVPAKVRQKPGVGPGSVLEWDDDDGRIVVRRAARYTSEDIHRSLFPTPPKPRTLGELREGVRREVKRRRAVVDTNILVPLITRDDPKQVAAADGPLATFDKDLGRINGAQQLRG
jgi:bifunctional DNA-binding transcriptional regulator/antitoxin component of YhaV-PrlF toxin-antitoxin module